MVSIRPIIQCSLLNVDMILVHHSIVLVIVVVLSVGLVDIQQFVLVIELVLSVDIHCTTVRLVENTSPEMSSWRGALYETFHSGVSM